MNTDRSCIAAAHNKKKAVPSFYAKGLDESAFLEWASVSCIVEGQSKVGASPHVTISKNKKKLACLFP